MTLSHTSSTIVATSQRAQSLFETKSQRTQLTTRYNLPVDSQIKHALHHRTARHPTDFFVIPFIFFCYNFFVCCDRLLIIGCKATQFSRHHQTFFYFSSKKSSIKHQTSFAILRLHRYIIYYFFSKEE